MLNIHYNFSCQILQKCNKLNMIYKMIIFISHLFLIIRFEICKLFLQEEKTVSKCPWKESFKWIVDCYAWLNTIKYLNCNLTASNFSNVDLWGENEICHKNQIYQIQRQLQKYTRKFTAIDDYHITEIHIIIHPSE